MESNRSERILAWVDVPDGRGGMLDDFPISCPVEFLPILCPVQFLSLLTFSPNCYSTVREEEG